MSHRRSRRKRPSSWQKWRKNSSKTQEDRLPASTNQSQRVKPKGYDGYRLKDGIMKGTPS